MDGAHEGGQVAEIVQQRAIEDTGIDNVEHGNLGEVSAIIRETRSVCRSQSVRGALRAA